MLLVKLVVFACLLLGMSEKAFCMDRIPTPTVTVVDEETGKPIEGAVAIAIWRKPSWIKGSFFEGGGLDVVRIEEAVSDSSGNIYIDGFWDWHLFENRYPDLDIYKFGYICWDKNVIFNDGGRWDFDNGHRIAHMKKWPKGFSFEEHRVFVDTITQGDYMRAPKQIFNKAFDYETSSRVEERNKKRKEEN
jgi:hypothetical protein